MTETWKPGSKSWTIIPVTASTGARNIEAFKAVSLGRQSEKPSQAAFHHLLRKPNDARGADPVVREKLTAG